MSKFNKLNERGSVELGLALIILAFLVGVYVALTGVATMWANVGF